MLSERQLKFRFEFPTEMRKMNSRLMHMSHQDRREYELVKYREYKEDLEG